MSTRPVRLITPIDILRNNRGKIVSIELDNGHVVNGTVVRADRTMNIVLRDSIRTSADGKQFWKCRECFVRGAAVKNVRMEASALHFVTRAKKSTDKSKKKVTRPK